MHALRQLEEAFVAAIDGTATAGASAARWRIEMYQEDELPALEVRAVRDELVTLGSDSQARKATIEVIARAKVADVAANTLYQIAAEVYGALMVDDPLYALVEAVVLTEHEMEIEQADQELGRCTMTFEVDYDVAREDLETIQT